MIDINKLDFLQLDGFDSTNIEALYYAFASPDGQTNIYNYDSAKLIKKTIDALLENDESFSGGNKFYYKLKKIGKFQSKSSYAEDEDVRRLDNSVNTLVNSNDSFEMILHKNATETGVICGGKDMPEQAVKSALMAWNDYAKTERIEKSSFVGEKYGFSGSAKCFYSKNNQKNEHELTNWISALIAADIRGKYRVTLSAEKTSEFFIKEKIKKLTELQKELEAINNLNLNITIGCTENESKNKVKGSFNPKNLANHKTFGSTNGDSISASLSQLSRIAVVKVLSDIIDDELKELTRGLSGGMKNISIFCQAENYADYQVVTSVISTALSKKDYAVRWIDGKTAKFAAEVPCGSASKFFCLPKSDFPGFERKKNEELAVNTPDETGDLELGKIYWNSNQTDRQFCIDRNKLNRHMSVFGMTGCGKSNTVFSILEQTDVPFMVIEPVKSEYKILKNKYDDLEIHHMNAQQDGVIQLNPFWFPPEGSLPFHMDAIKKIISSAFSLYAAMPNILEQCIYNCYVKKGWNVVNSVNVFADLVPEDYLYPTFSDLCEEIELYLNNSDFQGESLSSYQGALLSRLKSFTTGIKGVLLNTTNHPDFESWINTRHVIELDGLADDADKSIVMGSLIMQYFQCVKNSKKLNNKLNHIVVVEEAHRLFKNSGQNSSNQEVAAPEMQLVETLSNMMAEIRAYGEGFIIVDQSPGKVSQDVVSNSSTKIIHRLDNKTDIEMIEKSLLMDDLSFVISALNQGDAVVRTEGMEKPIKIRINKSGVKDSGAKYEYKSSGDGLENISNVDFIMNNEGFRNEFIALSNKFVNNLLFDDLNNSKRFFLAIIKELERLLYLHGFSEISANSDRQFYLMLLNDGIKKSLEADGSWSNRFILQMLLFSRRFCELISTGDIKRKEIEMLSEFRADVLHSQIEIKNRNSGAQAKGIAMLCGFYSIYTDLILRLSVLIDDSEIDITNEDNLTAEFFDALLAGVWQELFVYPPSDYVKNNIILILQMVYKAISQR